MMCVCLFKRLSGSDAECVKKSLFKVCPCNKIHCPSSLYVPLQLAEKVEQNLSQCLSMEIGDVTQVHLAASEQVGLGALSMQTLHIRICFRSRNYGILTKKKYSSQY